MELQEIIQRNYATVLRRGLINDNTKSEDLDNKISEEFYEFLEDRCRVELADLVLAAFTKSIHEGWDLLEHMGAKTLYNELRT